MALARRAQLVVGAAAILLMGGMATPARAQADKDGRKGQKPDAAAMAQAQADMQERQAVSQLADAAMAGQTPPSDFPIQFENDFLRAQKGRVWVPFTLMIDPARLSAPAGQPAALYVRVTPRGMTAPPAPPPDTEKDKKEKDKKKGKDKAEAPVASPYPFQEIWQLELKPAAAGQPIFLSRGFDVAPGAYDVYIVVRERPSQPGSAFKSAVLKQPIDAPNYANGEFSTSTIILATGVEQLASPISGDQQIDHPYSFGATAIDVSPDRKFKKTQELLVLLQVYNQKVAEGNKFNVEATYTFYKTSPTGETRFNATEPQAFTPDTMPGFDPSSPDRSIQAGQGIPLQVFPEGPYRLEIKVTDKLSSKVLTQSTTFTVVP